MNEPYGVKVNAHAEQWPLAEAFSISRGSKTAAEVVVVTLHYGAHRGRGECVPYGRYGETVEGALRAIEAMAPALAHGLDRQGLQRAMSAGTARNALDCALWDLEAKRKGTSVAALCGIGSLRPVTTAYTISLDTPDAMGQAAARAAHRPLLKVKLGAPGDGARIAAVRRAAPAAELIVDANEGWRTGNLDENIAACVTAGVTMIEQPLPAEDDAVLSGLPHPIAICADESVRGIDSLPALIGKYAMVNIKLDKAGGLTEALALADAVERMGFKLMVGSMVGTSLGMAPAMLLAQRAVIVDLDGPLLLARDRSDGLRVEGSSLFPPSPELWG